MPEQKQLPTWAAKQVIDHDDLNAVSDAVRAIQQRFGDNCPESVGQDYDGRTLDYFLAIVQAPNTSGLPDPNDGKQCYLKIAKPKETLQAGDAADVTEETYPGIGPADAFLATNLACLPNGGPMPPTDTPVLCFHFWTRGVDDATPVDVYVFWWSPAGTVQLKITAITASAGAKYSVVEVAPPTADVASSGDATTSDLGTVGSTTCIGIDENEIGRASHSHLNHVNTEVEGTILRTNSDGTKVYRFRQAPGPDVHFEVSLTQTGGSDGDKTHAASWTYTVAGLNGEQLGTVVSPEKPRPNGTSTAATAGEAYYTAAGALVLAEAYEKYGTGSC